MNFIHRVWYTYETLWFFSEPNIKFIYYSRYGTVPEAYPALQQRLLTNTIHANDKNFRY